MMEEEKEKKHTNRYKSLLVIQYLLKHADDENPVPIDQIQAHLSKYGIEAERKGIYSDIADFVDLLNTEQDDDNEIAEHDKLKYAIKYTRKPYPTSKKGGYLVTSRPYSFDELKLLTECVNSARFLSEAQAKNLRRTISKLCSVQQAKQLNTDSAVVNRSKTVNQTIMKSLTTINQAIRHGNQISFKYLSYSFNNMHTQVERRSGKPYTAEPYKMLIDNGFFYVMTYNGKKTFVYRIDRMKEVVELSEPREHEKAFKENVDLTTYTNRVFSMFGGKREKVTIQFRIEKLDTVVDQFGVRGVKYEMVDDKHFTVQTEVEVSDMFYSWLFGFRGRAKLIDPPHIVQEYHDHLRAVADIYE